MYGYMTYYASKAGSFLRQLPFAWHTTWRKQRKSIKVSGYDYAGVSGMKTPRME
jgi:hypothetical protein